MIKSLLRKMLTVLPLLAPLCLAPACLAQVYASQDGHYLDANPRYGSFGLNPNARLDPLVPRLGNMMVTGNVTGGASFRGLVPYQSPGEFSGTLGSTSLSNFQRDSFSIGAVASPRPYNPFVRGGFVAPSVQSRPPGGATLHSFTPYVSTSRATTTTQGGTIVGTSQLYQTSRPQAGPPPATSWASNQVNPLAVRPLGQSLYSLRYPGGGLDADRFAATLPPGEVFTPPGWQETLPDGRSPQVAPYDPFLREPAPEPLQPKDLRVQPLEPDQLEQGRSDPSGQDLPSQQAGQRVGTPGDQRPASVLEEFQAQLDGQAGLEGLARQEALRPPQDADLSPRQISPGQTPPGVTARAGLAALPSADAPPADAASLTLRPVVTREAFEQRSRQQYARHMRQGEQLLKQGEYYQAVNAFDNARMYQPNRGDSYLAKGMALFAAGEFMSAGFFVNRGLLIEPALATQWTVSGLSIDPERVQQQMAELQRWYGETKRPELLFLQGFIQYVGGQLDEAQATLHQVAQAAPQQRQTIGYLLEAIKATHAEQGEGS